MLRRAMGVRGHRRILLAIALIPACGRAADDLFCNGPGCEWSDGEWAQLAALAKLPPLPPDLTNRWADDAAAAALGHRLFYDTSFSGLSRQADSLRRTTTAVRAPLCQPIKVSCASCHELGRGGVDVSSIPGNVSVGAGMTDVNALPVVNAAYHKNVFWNGRLDSLWGLNLVVAESDTTMNGNRLQTAHLLATRYAEEVQAVFGAALPPDWVSRVAGLPAVGKPGGKLACQAGQPIAPVSDGYDNLSADDKDLAGALLVLWAKAIASYERLLISRDSAFDRFVAEGPTSAAISTGAQRGARLFVGKASCVDCHSGPLFTDDDFHDVGVPQTGPGVPTLADCAAGAVPCDCVAGKNCLPWGAYNGLVWQRDTGPSWWALLDGGNDDAAHVAHAPPREPFDPAIRGAWRTPSLRDVALTAPYMHDGVYRTLEEVLWHYNSGGRGVAATAVGTASVKLKPLSLTDTELADLAAFLRTLTGAPLPDALAAPPP
jgi:cytochrome c peroxidase